MVGEREWWRDPRCHFGDLDEDSPLLIQRADVRPAIEFISAELPLPPHARILDLCCGPGRHAVELALQGFVVVGLDLNERYIALARRLAARERVAAQFVVGDMRRLPFTSCFDAVINVGTSFGFFDAAADDRAVIAEVARVLRPGGIFLLEMGNRDYYLKYFSARDWLRL